MPQIARYCSPNPLKLIIVRTYRKRLCIQPMDIFNSWTFLSRLLIMIQTNRKILCFPTNWHKADSVQLHSKGKTKVTIIPDEYMVPVGSITHNPKENRKK